MKVKVSEIKSNPFRDLERLPIDRDKVEVLKGSIEETGFWDNLLVRRNHKGYQLAYGHHRLIAIMELGIEEIDIPIRDIPDVMMLKIMANENMEHWSNNSKIIIETVISIKNYLDSELSKYEAWEDAPRSLIDLLSLDNRHKFQDIKTKGVGQTTILKFLGKGWRQWRIQEALAVISDDTISNEAIKIFDSQTQATEFRKAVKDSKQEINKQDQLDLAKKVKTVLEETKGQEGRSGANAQRKTIKNIVKQETEGMDEFTAIVSELESGIDSITGDVKNLKNKILSFNGKLHEMNVETIKPLGSLFAVQEFTELLHGIKTMSEYFGVQFNKQIK